jgi:hypothetical protein
MVEDLRKQASEIYRQESRKVSLPTSDSLSVKRLFYLAAGLAILALLAIQISGGFKSRPDPIVAATTPAPLVKEAPPPELMQPDAPQPATGPEAVVRETKAPAREPRQQAGSAPTAETPGTPKPVVAPQPDQGLQAPVPSSTTPASGLKPVLKRDTATEAGAAKPASRSVKAKTPPETTAPQPPAAPGISPAEKARRELARDIVVQQKPALAQLLIATKSQDWQAEPQQEDAYYVSFVIPDEATGKPVEYVWKVDLSTKSVVPLSYYARRLP